MLWKKIKKHQEKILLLLLFSAALLTRLYKINNPVADWHSWRQVDTASVSKYLLKNNFDLFHPRFHDLSAMVSGQENPQGWRFVEFPVYNTIHAGFYKILPAIDFDVWGRSTSILSSLMSLSFLYLLVKRIWDEKTAFLTGLFFALLPFNIYYSRAILPGPLAIAFSLAAIYFLLRFIETKNIINQLLAILCGALALLTKPYAVFLIAPPCSYLVINQVWQKRKNLAKTLKSFFPFLIIAFFMIAPLILWRLWMKNFPAGIPSNVWLFNAGKMRFKPVWWRWLFYERIAKIILGGWGIFLLSLGLIVKRDEKADIFMASFLIGAFAYLITFARGNIQHDYYQLMIIPALCIYLGRGSSFLLYENKKKFYQWPAKLLFVIIFIFTIGFSFFEVRGYYQINHPDIITAGQKADQTLPLNAKVIAPYQGDTAFLYQINRPGWPVITASLEEMIDKGATHYVAVNFDEVTKNIMKDYQVLEKTDHYVIIGLEKQTLTQ